MSTMPFLSLIGFMALTLAACGNNREQAPLEVNQETSLEILDQDLALNEELTIVEQDLQGLGQDLVERIVSIESQWQEMEPALGCQDSSQCQAIAIGHKACGGPAGFLPASSLHPEFELVQQLAREHRMLTEQFNLQTGAMSDCALETEPVLICQDNRCQIGSDSF